MVELARHHTACTERGLVGNQPVGSTSTACLCTGVGSYWSEKMAFAYSLLLDRKASPFLWPADALLDIVV